MLVFKILGTFFWNAFSTSLISILNMDLIEVIKWMVEQKKY